MGRDNRDESPDTKGAPMGLNQNPTQLLGTALAADQLLPDVGEVWDG